MRRALFNDKFITIALSLSFFLVLLATITHYGINWDTINHLPRGQVYFHYFLTGKKDFTDRPSIFGEGLSPSDWYWQKPQSLLIDTSVHENKISRLSLYERAGVDYKYFIEKDGNGHPPLSDILSSFFNFILFQKLGIINDIDAYRIYGVFLAALLVGLVYFWTSKVYGKFAGLVASISLSIYPLFFSESHFNTEKDIPETVYWSFMLFSIWQAFRKKSILWILISGVLFGLALGTKFNILFAVFAILPWAILYLIKNGWFKLKFFLSLPLIPLIGLFIFFVSWPYLWTDPLYNISTVIKFYKEIGTNTISTIQFYPIKAIIYSTPIVILIFSFLGIMRSIKVAFKEKYLTSLLILLWFLVPIVRVSLPGGNVYGGIRQIMEFIPAMAILSGIGASMIWVYLNKILKNKIIVSSLVLLCFLPITLKLVKIHPNENVYLNPLIGGLSGAKVKNFPYWGNSFGAAYRQGVIWINENAEKDANIVYARELIPNIPRIWFRPDLTLYNGNRSGYLVKGEYVITLTYKDTEQTSYFDRYLDRFLVPVYIAEVDGVPILKVWKNDLDHTHDIYKKDLRFTNFNVAKLEGGITQFDFGKTITLSRIEATLVNKDCSNLSFGYIQISKDGASWERLPGQMPNEDWSVPKIGVQPAKGGLVVPFAADVARFVRLVYSPYNSCLSGLKDIKSYVFP